MEARSLLDAAGQRTVWPPPRPHPHGVNEPFSDLEYGLGISPPPARGEPLFSCSAAKTALFAFQGQLVPLCPLPRLCARPIGPGARPAMHGVSAQKRHAWGFPKEQPPEAVHCSRRLSPYLRLNRPLHGVLLSPGAPGRLVRLGAPVHYDLLASQVNLHRRPQVAQLRQQPQGTQVTALGFR